MADKFQNLYIETNKPPRSALVKSTGVNSPITQLPSFIAGDTISYNIFLLTNGVIDTGLSGQAGVYVKAAVGNYGGILYATSSNWYCSSSAPECYTGSINTNTTNMSSSMVGYESITGLFELEITSSTARKTYCQLPVQIFSEVIPQTPE